MNSIQRKSKAQVFTGLINVFIFSTDTDRKKNKLYGRH